MTKGPERKAIAVLKEASFEFPLYLAKSAERADHADGEADIGGVIVSRKGRRSLRALESINLEVRIGDRIGILGPNGSGKSTLLRLISGIYKPTSGSVNIGRDVRVISVLSPQAGMDPELSVYRNIFLRSYFLGYRAHEVKRHVEEIIAFSELYEFVDLPLRTLSPGMQARLGFAVSTAYQADVLLLDEWLGAGDQSFREKAQERMSHLFNSAGAVVICSHNDSIISENCNRILNLKKGRLRVE